MEVIRKKIKVYDPYINAFVEMDDCKYKYENKKRKKRDKSYKKFIADKKHLKELKKKIKQKREREE
jgi:hypothetical protein